MGDKPPKDNQFSDQEARKRFKQALRGARLAEPKPLKDVPKKRGESQRDKPKGRRRLAKGD